ncbi:hypothetical protein RSSM_05206 [Rhodopirellula sallentina SM41]|uniref:Uncharacterized protein n=1 Tax=Rhodopirellula sallentina SM41 TaxID=1263870 RepID=M5U673_9BACT|nr:hypothetical protein RSSM_05206 [Rhodopirellula sallentina SM41]
MLETFDFKARIFLRCTGVVCTGVVYSGRIGRYRIRQVASRRTAIGGIFGIGFRGLWGGRRADRDSVLGSKRKIK